MDSTPPDCARRRCRRLRRHFAGAGGLAVHDVVLLDQSETCGSSDLMPHQYEDQWPDTTIFRGNIGDRGLADDSFTDVQRPMEFEPRAGPHTAWQRDGRQEAAALEVTPLSSQATASPSIMQERERRRANVSTISGKR